MTIKRLYDRVCCRESINPDIRKTFGCQKEKDGRFH